MLKLLTTQDAAEILGVTPSRIRQLILSGKLKATKNGRDWVLMVKDVQLSGTGRNLKNFMQLYLMEKKLNLPNFQNLYRTN